MGLDSNDLFRASSAKGLDARTEAAGAARRELSRLPSVDAIEDAVQFACESFLDEAEEISAMEPCLGCGSGVGGSGER